MNTAAKLREAPFGDNNIRASLPSGGPRPPRLKHPCRNRMQRLSAASETVFRERCRRAPSGLMSS
ncbi:hypothetical protein GCM10009825_24090 [Arthrobacter humicola]|uniref:Uncharacterized protein n=1 Tax=Arthrobacter humicola TaxID=409291 RepID=A0ABN2Z7G6_9MICC